MKVATVDGLVTLFYDGSKPLFNDELNDEWWDAHQQHTTKDDWEEWNLSEECREYWRERLTWQQIIIEEGVTEIPEMTFVKCYNIKRVIFANTVIRIEEYAFLTCRSLVFCKFPINLEYIGEFAFFECDLYSVFTPPSCREICQRAFWNCKNLSILNVPQETQLGRCIISGTALAKSSPFQPNANSRGNDDMNTWIKTMNHGEAFALHRACSSFQPLKQVLYNIIEEKGLKAFKEKNSAGITPSQYLNENPYSELTEKEIIHDYVMKLMGEGE